jgi:hypothetical protein
MIARERSTQLPLDHNVGCTPNAVALRTRTHSKGTVDSMLGRLATILERYEQAEDYFAAAGGVGYCEQA